MSACNCGPDTYEPHQPWCAKRLIGIQDLYETVSPYPPVNVGNWWYWCRTHEQAEQWVDATKYVCVRIGPFVSKWEADRLGGCSHPKCERGGPAFGYCRPLGMEVEGA